MTLSVENAKRIAKKLGATYQSVSEFRSGAHNKMFLLKTTTGKYLIRVRTNTVQYHKPLSTEYSMLQIAGEEFAPKVFFLDRSRKILPQEYFVEEFLEGRTPKRITAHIAKEQGAYYRRLHTTRKAPVPQELASKGKYSLCKKLERLIRQAPRIDAETNNLIEELRAHARKYETACARRTVSLTQDDPTRGNILLTKNGLRMVDWEFAHYDLPEWDIAFFVWSIPEYEREYLQGYGVKNSRIIDILLPIHTLGMLLWQLERLDMIRKGTVKGQTHNNQRQFLKEITQSKQRIRVYLRRSETRGLKT